MWPNFKTWEPLYNFWMDAVQILYANRLCQALWLHMITLRDPFWDFGTPLIFLEWLKIEVY